MSDRFYRNVKRIGTIHLVIILTLLSIPLVQRCARKPEPPPIITYVDLAAPPPAPEPAVIDKLPPLPEPEPQPRPKAPIPEPEPEPQPKPKPKKKIERSTKRIRRPDAPEPRPVIDDEKIRKTLADELLQDMAAPTVSGDLPGWYYALIRKTFYDVWQQPGGLTLPVGAVTRVRIRVQRDGHIASREQVQSSGHAQMDESVMQAVRQVPQLRPLPDSFTGKYRDITVDFELSP